MLFALTARSQTGSQTLFFSFVLYFEVAARSQTPVPRSSFSFPPVSRYQCSNIQSNGTHSSLISLFIKVGLNIFSSTLAKYCFCPRVFSGFTRGIRKE